MKEFNLSEKIKENQWVNPIADVIIVEDVKEFIQKRNEIIDDFINRYGYGENKLREQIKVDLMPKLTKLAGKSLTNHSHAESGTIDKEPVENSILAKGRTSGSDNQKGCGKMVQVEERGGFTRFVCGKDYKKRKKGLCPECEKK